MKQKILAATGGAMLTLMGILGLVLGNEILPIWHCIISIILGASWIFAGWKLNVKIAKKINIVLSLIILFFSVAEFIVPSFLVFSIGTGMKFYAIHPYLSAIFGVALFLFAVVEKIPKQTVAVVMVLACVFNIGCGKKFTYKYHANPIDGSFTSFPDVSFDIVSDIHVYDRTLGTSGKAFEYYLEHDRKDLIHSQELLDAATLATPSPILLVTGDLTKDGERKCHAIVADKLRAIEKQGRKVYVICGNHDINNPDAMRFNGDKKEPVETIQPDDFRKFYADFGYDEAVMKDTNSLSYVAEPVPGLWLLAIDSTDSADNFKKGAPEVNGKLNQARVDWIENTLIESKKQRKAVIVMTHHGIIEHYEGQEKYFGDYLLDDENEIATMLTKYGVKTVFTGHYHANDITEKDFDGKPLFDIETGSLVTWPNSFRHVQIKGNTMNVSLSMVTELSGVSDFESKSRSEASRGIITIGKEVMDSLDILGMKMSKAEIDEINPQISEAFLAHYKGNEHFEGKDKIKYKGLSVVGKMVVGRQGPLVVSQWNDLLPDDWNVEINLETGKIQ